MDLEEPALRYVVLHHIDIEQPHYDLMFETAPGSMLASVRLSNWPVDRMTTIESSPNHRRNYLEFEGHVSQGRGQVIRYAAGTLRIVSSDPDYVIKLDSGLTLALPKHGMPIR